LYSYNGGYAIRLETEKVYGDLRWSLAVDVVTTDKDYILKINGVWRSSGMVGQATSPAKFGYEITDLTNDTYTVKCVYDTSIDIYELTVDAVKYEMSPMSGSFTYFENTADMVYYK